MYNWPPNDVFVNLLEIYLKAHHFFPAAAGNRTSNEVHLPTITQLFSYHKIESS